MKKKQKSKARNELNKEQKRGMKEKIRKRNKGK